MRSGDRNASWSPWHLQLSQLMRLGDPRVMHPVEQLNDARCSHPCASLEALSTPVGAAQVTQ